MKRFVTTMMAALALVVSASAAGKLKVSDLPEAVQKTVKAETANATIVGISKEKEDGIVQYEVETKVNGKVRDFNVDSKGKLIVVEEEVSIDSIPAPAKEAILKKVGAGKLGMVESVLKDGKTSYEAAYTPKTGKKTAVMVHADGSPAK